MTLLTMCGKVKLQDHASNNLVIQTLSTIEWESLQPFVKVYGPMTHDVIGGNLPWLKVVTCTPDNNIVNVSIPKDVKQWK